MKRKIITNNTEIKEGYIEVIKTIDGEDFKKDKTIQVKEFKTNTAFVAATFSKSGKFGNPKVSVTIGIPCYTEEVDNAVDYVLTETKEICDNEFEELK